MRLIGKYLNCFDYLMIKSEELIQIRRKSIKDDQYYEFKLSFSVKITSNH